MPAIRTLITGGSGFIGTHLVAAALARGHEVLNIDIRAPRSSDERAMWRNVDILDADAVAACLQDFAPTVIYNLAAVADIALAAAAMPANTKGLANIVSAALDLPVRPRLVHASTQLVVSPGHVPAHPRDYRPYTEYGESKAQSEEILWTQAQDLRWTVVRPTTIWGPHHATFGSSIWKYLARRWYLLPTGVDPVRSYGYVGTIVEQMMAILDAPSQEVDQRIFYVGDAPIRSSAWLDGFSRAMTGCRTRRIPGVALRALAEAGEWLGRIGGPSPINRGRLFRMTTDYPVPMEETFRVLGEGKVGLEQGIAQTVAWLREDQPDLYARR